MKLQNWASGSRNNDEFGYRNAAAIDNVEAIKELKTEVDDLKKKI